MPASLSRTQSRMQHQAQYQPQYQPQYQQYQPPEQQQQQQPSRRPSRRRTHSADPVPRRHSTRARPRPDPATLLRRRASARPAGRESAAAVERWMDGWHGDDDDGGDGDGWEREPQPLLPPRRDDERVLATGAWDEHGGAEEEGVTPRRRRTLHRVGGRESLI